MTKQSVEAKFESIRESVGAELQSIRERVQHLIENFSVHIVFSIIQNEPTTMDH
jgi:hypothetical protein